MCTSTQEYNISVECPEAADKILKSVLIHSLAFNVVSEEIGKVDSGKYSP